MQQEVDAEREQYQGQEGLGLVGWAFADRVRSGRKQGAMDESLDGQPEE